MQAVRRHNADYLGRRGREVAKGSMSRDGTTTRNEKGGPTILRT